MEPPPLYPRWQKAAADLHYLLFKKEHRFYFILKIILILLIFQYPVYSECKYISQESENILQFSDAGLNFLICYF